MVSNLLQPLFNLSFKNIANVHAPIFCPRHVYKLLLAKHTDILSKAGGLHYDHIPQISNPIKRGREGSMDRTLTIKNRKTRPQILKTSWVDMVDYL